MTPGARVAAAIECLDEIANGAAAERVLTTWARRHRFAGSKDRAAIRDHVFDALRRWRSTAALGGGATGRARMIGLLRGTGADPAAYFTGEGHAPPSLSAVEAAYEPPEPSRGEALDMPDWVLPLLDEAYGAEADRIAAALRDRAPVFLRVNLSRATRAGAVAQLTEEGIVAVPHPLAESALEVTEGARGVQSSAAFRDGLFELQDAASQAVVEALPPVSDGARVLDYCAGGGGKALALADRTRAQVFAHDADPGRMRDLPARAARQGVRIPMLSTGELPAAGPFDLVFADAPCSGSGAWRRQPEAKWRLTPDRLDELTRVQSGILDAAAALVAQGGTLAYATCSLFQAENAARIEDFLTRWLDWKVSQSRQFTPLDGGDGFFLTTVTR